MALLDSETLERLKSLAPGEALWEVKSAIYRCGTASSEDFEEAFEQMVEAGVLTWDEIDRLEGP
ncbi:MAG: hypothetical protein HY049_17985 [Acidobacteria bacterium]|nr:hypothetical protein [Acidobacteriota bacterium]